MKKNDLISLWKGKNRPLILDGAVGSALQDNIRENKLLWSSWLNIENPEAVIQLHRNYIESGAEIITTNTFRTNPNYYKKYDLKYSQREFVAAGVNLAKIARNERNVLIAGSNPPAEDCYQAERTIALKELENNHKLHIDLLIKSGVDFILNETQSHLDEIKIICKHCSENNIQFVVSLFLKSDYKILSGESIEDVIALIASFNPMAIAFNCFLPETYTGLSERIPEDINTGFYLNCGSGSFTDEKINCHIQPEQYVNQVKQFITPRTVFIGSCCGSNPMHTHSLKAFINEKN